MTASNNFSFQLPDSLPDQTNIGVRLRFETLFKLASELGDADSYANVKAILSSNLKYLMEAYGFVLFFRMGESRITFVSFPSFHGIHTDPLPELEPLAARLRTLDRPGFFSRADLDALAEFDGSPFRRPKVKAALSCPLDLGSVGDLLLIVANKNLDHYHPVDFKFARFLLRFVGNKLEQLYSQSVLQRTHAEREQLLAQLHSEKSFSEQVLSVMSSGLVITDSQGLILSVNPAFEALCGRSSSKMIGQFLFDVLFEGNPMLGDSPILERAFAGSFRETDGLILSAQGEWIPVQFGCSPMEGVDGDSGLVVSLLDLRQRLAVEQQMKETELALAVAANERKRAGEFERLNAELDRFVYSASHELRAPLQSVLGLVDLLQLEVSAAGPMRDYLQLMGGSIQQLDGVIQNIVLYSRNANLDVSVASLDFPALVEEVWAGLSFLKGFSSVVFSFSDGGVGAIVADGERLRIVLRNLLSNAINFRSSDVAVPRVWLEAGFVDEGLALVVRDNGIGVPVGLEERVFDMFFRASASGGGSGLGLYIVRKMLVKLGGRVVCERIAEGEGSVFRAVFPCEGVG